MSANGHRLHGGVRRRSRRAQYEAIHRQAGVRERGYVQPTPAGGYLYLVAWEGEGDPAALVQRLVQAGQADADFARWFFSQSQAVHGIDASQGFPPLPAQVIDSGPL